MQLKSDVSLGVGCLDTMILGVSGWRKVFAASGKEQGLGRALSPVDEGLVLRAALMIGAFFVRGMRGSQKVLLARDTRPTGERIVQVFRHVFDEEGVPYVDIGVQALPQAMATVKMRGRLRGMVYITASHNPPGYNGIKLVNEAGSVLSRRAMEPLIRSFQKACHHPSKGLSHVLLRLMPSLSALPLSGSRRKQTAAAMSESSQQNAREDYGSLVETASFGKEGSLRLTLRREAFQKGLAKGQRRYELLCDMNGSARIHAIDRDYFMRHHVMLRCMNHRLGKFSHRIVPEGVSLRSLRAGMRPYREELLWGYAVDADGDRANLVVYDEKAIPRALSAQATFYLVALSELAYKALFLRQRKRRLAVVTNEVTSLAVKALCESFEVEVFQAEVGEANGLALAEQKNKKGYEVLLLGEGSNGGCMVPPSTVRDPLLVMMSLLKLLFLEDERGGSLLSLVVRTLGCSKSLLSLPKNQVLEALHRLANPFITTAVFESRALVSLPGLKAETLQRVYLHRFRSAFKACQAQWAKRYDFHHYKVYSYQGSQAHDLTQKTTQTLKASSLRGGLKVVFYNPSDEARGFFWLRFSQTEPVCRLAVDVMGTPLHEQQLLRWHRDLLLSCVSP